MPARLGCSLSTVVEDLAVLRRAAGDVWVRGAAKGPHRNVLADPAALTQMRAAAAQGRSVSWIARMLGVSQKAVTKHLQAEVMADAA
jgi:DNA-binding transcriptional LysR family regulator